MSDTQPLVAYFCAEFGIESNLPVYAGGLGILAGDTLKQAAEQGFPMIGIGLLYRGDGAIQHITLDGKQEERDMPFDPVAAGLEHVYVDDMPLFVKVHLTEVDVWARCWKKTLSPTVSLYLLDTDTDQNEMSERSITHLLYAGTEESVIKQQLLLGIGGVKLLHALNIHPDVYHVQEGRPAFLHWQLIRSNMDAHGLEFAAAVEAAKKKTAYTNHTLVAAGNQSYDAHLLRRYAGYYADKMGINVDALLKPGFEGSEERFFITRFALNTSRVASGVSQLHTKLSEESWPGYNWKSITNGVHMKTWQAKEIWEASQKTKETGDSKILWDAHQQQKNKLAAYVQERTGFTYDPNRMVITWARRLAGYKRFDALFKDIPRLKAILTNPAAPTQLLIAGKAHRLDTHGKQLLQELISYMSGELAGHVLFIPNYNIELAQHLVAGSDVWLNTPEIGKEACGTSGMKAISNGVLNATVLDGWAAEVDWTDTGWSLDSNHIHESLYTTLEQHIQPLYFQKNTNGVSEQWVQMMRHSIELSQKFSAERMLSEYAEQLYS
jgi:glycogen phosphorylase